MCNSIILRNLLILGNNRWQQKKVYWKRGILVELHINKHYIIKSTHSMEHSPWEASQFSASQEIPALYGTWRFITMFTSVHQLSLSWASSTQSKFLHPTCHLNMILPSMPESSKRSLSLRFPLQNPVCSTRLPSTCSMSRPSPSPWFHYLNNIWWQVEIIKLLIT